MRLVFTLSALSLGLVLHASFPAAGQPVMRETDLRAELRYDTIDRGRVRDRVQGAVRLRFRAELGAVGDLAGFIVTGNSFTSRWSTIRNLDGSEAPNPLGLHLRHLFFQRTHPRYRVQAGAVPPVKNVVSPTGLEPVGWIDGVRFEWFNAAEGVVEFVIGRLGSLSTPNAFARPSPFVDPSRINYLELEVSQQVTGRVGVEASAEHFLDPFLRGEVRRRFGGSAEAIVEALLNLDTRAINTGVTVELDLLPERLSLAVNHAFKDPDIGLRGELADDFFTFGHSVTLKPSGVISKEWGLGWSVEAIFAERPAPSGSGEPFPSDEGVYTRLKVVLGWRVR